MIALLNTIFATYDNLFANYPASRFWLSRF